MRETASLKKEEFFVEIPSRKSVLPSPEWMRWLAERSLGARSMASVSNRLLTIRFKTEWISYEINDNSLVQIMVVYCWHTVSDKVKSLWSNRSPAFNTSMRFDFSLEKTDINSFSDISLTSLSIPERLENPLFHYPESQYHTSQIWDSIDPYFFREYSRGCFLNCVHEKMI